MSHEPPEPEDETTIGAAPAPPQPAPARPRPASGSSHSHPPLPPTGLALQPTVTPVSVAPGSVLAGSAPVAWVASPGNWTPPGDHRSPSGGMVSSAIAGNADSFIGQELCGYTIRRKL